MVCERAPVSALDGRGAVGILCTHVPLSRARIRVHEPLLDLVDLVKGDGIHVTWAHTESGRRLWAMVARAVVARVAAARAAAVRALRALACS